MRGLWSIQICLLTTSACGPGQVTPAQTCSRSSTTAEAPTLRQLATLAGRYEMTMVNSERQDGDSLIWGVLVLWANDSARRYMPRTIGRRPGERPLAGRFESHSPTIESVPNSYEPEGREDPAVEMVDGTIYLGGLEYSDAGGNQLGVKEITATGFLGVWSYAAGFSITVDSTSGQVVREPSGYFCARRIPQA